MATIAREALIPAQFADVAAFSLRRAARPTIADGKFRDGFAHGRAIFIRGLCERSTHAFGQQLLDDENAIEALLAHADLVADAYCLSCFCLVTVETNVARSAPGCRG